MAKKEERFEVIFRDGSSLKDEGIRQILVDKETGVNYLCWTSGNGAGITPLLDSEEFDKSFTYKEKLKLPGQLF